MAASNYDVWIPNARGNHYSRHHECLDPDDPFSGFWDFSFDDIGTKDFPAVVDYIRCLTNQSRLFMICYSQGSSSMLAFLSEKSQYNQYIKAISLMAPASYMRHSRALIRFAATFEKPLNVNICVINKNHFTSFCDFIFSYLKTWNCFPVLHWAMCLLSFARASYLTWVKHSLVYFSAKVKPNKIEFVIRNRFYYHKKQCFILILNFRQWFRFISVIHPAVHQVI